MAVYKTFSDCMHISSLLGPHSLQSVKLLEMDFISLLLLVMCICSTLVSCHNVNIMTENSSCGSMNASQLECAAFHQCLTRISNCIMANTTLTFQPGIHPTTGVSGLVEIRNINNVRFLGRNSTIKCHGNVGFMFRRVDGLQIRGLSFQNCGTIISYSVVTDLVPSQDPQVFLRTKVALIIAHSYNVQMRDVGITNSTGYGLFAVNLLGNSSVCETNVSHSNYAAISLYQHDFDACKNPENHACAGGNVLLLYEECSVCSNGPHQLEVSNLVAEFGANLQNWDVNFNTEAAGGLTIDTRQQSQYSVTIVVRDSWIASNVGKYGGNAVVLFYTANSHVSFRNTSFLNGNAEVRYYAEYSNSGGLYNYWGQLYDEGPFSKYFIIENCTFANNSGGAVYISSITDSEIRSQLILMLHIENSNIIENRGHGGIVRLSAFQTGESSIPSNYLSITLSNTRINNNHLLHPSNTSIMRKQSYDSALRVSEVHGLNLISITVAGNGMRGIYVFSTTLFRFSGSSYISDNVAIDGGGMKLFRSSFLVQPESYLYITNNHASSYGGGKFVQEDASYTCFFQLRNITNASEPRIIMGENSANLSGNSIFGGNVDLCHLDGVSIMNGRRTFEEQFDIPYNNSLTEVTSLIRQLCFCREQKPDCTIRLKVISTFPGQEFSVFAVAVGQLNGTIVDTALSHIMNSSAPVILDSRQDAQELLTVCTQLNFSLKSSGENEVTFIGLQTNYDKTHLPNSILLSVKLHTTACPLGFSLDQQLMVCDCNLFLQRFGVKCFINQKYNIHSPLLVWIGYESDQSLLLGHKSCPLQYCKSKAINWTFEEADLQCQPGHSGILCGGCKKNLSVVFGTSACKECSNNYLSLVLVFFFAGLLLVATMLYCDLTLSRGTFNGLIFYANIVRVHHSILFPSNHINVVTVFIAWLNLDLGIEVCFYNGMDAYARAWLQYLFPAYVWILVVLVIFAAWYSKYAAKIFGNNAVQVLATLLLLSYTKIQRIVLQTWSSTFVTHENGSFSVWLVDGNVLFMRGKHILLCCMSLVLVMGFLVPFTVILLCEYPLQSKCGTLMLRYKLTPLVDVYQGSYKIKFRWWSGVMLLVRSALLLVFGLNIFGDPQLNLVLIVSVCTILLGLMWNVGTIYKERYINVIESFFLVNLGLLSALSLYNSYTSSSFFLLQEIFSYTCVGSSLLLFIAMVGSQIFFRLKKKFGKSKSGPAESGPAESGPAESGPAEIGPAASKTSTGFDSFREPLM